MVKATCQDQGGEGGGLDPDQRDYRTPSDACSLAARVHVSARQIRNLIKRGELDHVMIGARVHIPV